MCDRKFMFGDNSTFGVKLEWSKHAQKGQQKKYCFVHSTRANYPSYVTKVSHFIIPLKI